MRLFYFLLFAATLFCPLADAGDWPMWRYAASRGASTPDAIPIDLELHWVRACPASMPAWPPTQPKLQFDVAPQPVVMGRQLFIPSNHTDSITACDTRTGKKNWHFYADAPIRFAPIAAHGKVYFCSDDGYLYALDAGSGKQLWRVDGGPTRRLVLGNRRLISSWPARGGPVLHQGKLFFAASIWPFMGIFIHAVDPDTGAVLWTNSGDGANFIVQPHDAPSFAGVVPQGHLAASGDYLVIPGGRSTPGVFDTKTGKLLSFFYDKRLGGHATMAGPQCYFNDDKTFFLDGGESENSKPPAVFDEKQFVADESGVIRLLSGQAKMAEKKVKDNRGKKQKEKMLSRKTLSEKKVEQKGRWRLRAGDMLFSVDGRTVAAYDVNTAGKSLWQAELPCDIWEILAADDRLFVVTIDAQIHCFGPGVQDEVRHALDRQPPTVPTTAKATADRLLSAAGSRDGHALALGIDNGDLITAVIMHSKLHVIAVDSDAKKVAMLRDRLVTAGLYGERCSVLQANADVGLLPAYMCHVIFSETARPDMLKGGDIEKVVFRSLRPFGGRAVFAFSDSDHRTFAARVAAARLPKARLERRDGLSILHRDGALPNTADWTHQYADAAQSVISQDSLIKAPMGVLWFGGASHEGILPRHGHGPSPQVAGGRLVIEGADKLRSVDVYTGRVIWEREIKDLGKYYDNTSHFPGAGEIGGNYVTLADRVYAVKGASLLELDAATGETVKTFELDAAKEGDSFGFLAVSGDYLVTTSSPIQVNDKASKKSGSKPAIKVPTNSIEVIPPNDKWQYLAGKDATDGWYEPGFKAIGWEEGKAGFGYGDDDDNTTLDMGGKFSRVYIRHDFDAKQVKDASELILTINFDDAYIAYLNGTEIVRDGVSSGSGAQAGEIRNHEANGYVAKPIKDFRKLIRPGTNVLAIEGHNAGLGSSDFSLDPYLLAISKEKQSPKASPAPAISAGLAALLKPTQYSSASRQLRVYNRHTGKLLWTRAAAFNFRHNNIAASATQLFCIDKFSEGKLQTIKRRGIQLQGKPVLYALDLASGKVNWQTNEGIFGTFLNYSVAHDTLLQAGSAYRDRARDEIRKGMTAYRGSDGKQLWKSDESYSGPLLLWKERILTNGGSGKAIDIKTGKQLDWSWSRHYGCNTAIGSQNLLTFRSGAAGFYDLAGDSGTGNLGGFKSSCTANLIPANGLLNAPDYTRTCDCSYQNQTSLALVHMPEAEFWTFGAKPQAGRIGVNFGAPGDRKDKQGTLWVDYPSVGGSSHKVDVKVEGKDLRYHRRHSATLKARDMAWVAASGVTGVSSVTVALPGQEGPHTVRLHFADPGDGGSTFDVQVQGKTAIKELSVAGQSLIKTINGVDLAEQLSLTFTARKGRASISGIEIIAE